jgi:hypothetical protein
MSTRPNTPPDYKTTDLYLAAYLKTAGVDMKRTDREEAGRVYFVFDASVANIEELKAAWFNNTGRVVANTYAYHIKNLKSLCHSK